MLNKLLEILAEFDANATIEEQRAAIQHIARLHKRLSIRIMSEVEQRTALIIAETSGNKAELRALAEHSQYSDIVSWARESLAPRGPMYPRFSI
jgi:hypothetical protein